MTHSSRSEQNSVAKAVSLHNQALAAQEGGSLAKVQWLARQPLRMLEELLPPQHPDLSNVRNTTASIALQQGDHAEAERMERHQQPMVPAHNKGENLSSSSANSSVTEWIAGLKEGQAEAAERLWHRYFDRLVWLARRILGSAPRRAADEEDVAAIVFRNLWQGAEAGRFPGLRNRQNLWPLLVVLTLRRVHDLLRYEKRRGGGDVPDELDHLISEEPTPEFAAIMAENVTRLFDLLDPVLKQVAQGKLEGRDNAEIARALCCSQRTVERKLQVIRRIWDANP